MASASINGIILLDKPTGFSSNTAVQKIKRLFNAKKAGHTGALDPLASGILPICLGEATKFSQYLLEADKVYTVSGQLGATTPTGDAEGDVEKLENPPHITQTQLEAVLKTFLGESQQIPPMYSALKKDGVPLYRLARQGKTIDRSSRTIRINQLTLIDFDSDKQIFTLTVHCSKGTYIRTLVEDIAKALNTGAYTVKLRRDAIGPHTLDNAITLETLSSINLHSHLLPVDTLILHFPVLHLDADQAQALQHGKIITMPHITKIQTYRLINSNNTFIGLGDCSSTGELKAKRLINFVAKSILLGQL